MDPRSKHHFTCIVAGPTGCGKTTFVARLLRNSSTMIDPSTESVTWYYGEWQSVYENLDIPNLYLEGLPTSFDASKRNIVVLNDLMAETDERVTNLFTRCVANDYIGQTDVPRSSHVCSGGVRRCDVRSLRVHFGRSETGHPRRSTLAHVHTTGRCC